MSNTPSKAEIEALVKRHGATSYRNRADTQHPAYGFTEDGLNGLIDEVLAKWGSPQPAPAPLSECLRLLNSFEYEGDEDSQAKAFFKAHINEDWFFHVKNSLELALAAQGGK